MPHDRLKYLGFSVTMQEVPGEISIAFNISGCPHSCDGCHSPELQEYSGRFLSDEMCDILVQYDGLFSCVCFLGGDHSIDELLPLSAICKAMGYKTCIYSGTDNTALLDEAHFDYVKLGRYIQTLGGLDSPTTNQKMHKYVDGKWEDITHAFYRRYRIED